MNKSYGINSFTLKMIAIVGMTMDHIGNVYWHYLPDWARIICFAPGGLTFPIMAYLLTEGYKHTKDVKKYALRLLMFALISLIPFIAATGYPRLNVLFTLFLGLIVIYLYDHMKNPTLFLGVFIGATMMTAVCDWKLIGIPMILCYHVIKDEKKRVIVPIIITWNGMVLPDLIFYFTRPNFNLIGNLPNMLYCIVGCTATIPLLLNYNGERGRPMKYFFYVYYPAHFVVLFLVKYVLFGIGS